MGTSITTPVTASFNGTSTYASSLQQVITKALVLASLPMQYLQGEQTDIQNKISAEQSLQSKITSLNSALQGLSTSSGSLLSTSVSDPTVAQATAGAGALAGTYTLDVTTAGSYSTAISQSGLTTVSDPSSQSISSSSSFTLSVGSTQYTIQPSGNNLNALADAINSSGAGVQATVINVGGSTPDYRLALQNTSYGADAIQLNDGTSDLLSTLATGQDAVYRVNWQPSGGISTTSPTVTIAPGLTATLAGAGTTTINVGLSTSSLSDALNTFVTAFNNAQAELQKSYGQNAGPLLGDSSVFSTSNALRQLVNYVGTGNMTSLTDLGIEFTQQGTLTFDSSKVSSLSSSQLSDLTAFLGDPNTGGFLQSATNTLNGLLDPTNGLLPNEINDLNNQSTEQSQRIAQEQNSLNQLQNNLTTQMAAADALIASLQQQTNFLTQLFSTMNANSFSGH